MAKDFLNVTPSATSKQCVLPLPIIGKDDRITIEQIRYMLLDVIGDKYIFARADGSGLPVEFTRAYLARLNALGAIHHEIDYFLPEHLRKQPVRVAADLALPTISPAQRGRVDVRYAFVMATQFLKDHHSLKITDEHLKAAMPQIREIAAYYLLEDVSPELAARISAWQKGEGKKPNASSLPPTPPAMAASTIRNWRKLYNAGGKCALIDKAAKQGNFQSYYTPEENALLMKTVSETYLTRQRKSQEIARLAVRDVFKEENESREKEGKKPLRIPGRQAVRNCIHRIDKFVVVVARFGAEEAMKRMRVHKGRVEYSRPFERVEMDEWQVDLISIMARGQLFQLFTPEELEVLGLNDSKGRWWLVMAIDCRTRCIVGMALTKNPKATAAVHCLRMVVSDKGVFSDAVGALSAWSQFGKPEVLATDNGAAFKSTVFTNACTELGIHALKTIAGQPSMRGRIERVFNTMAVNLMPRLSGRTFGKALDRNGDDGEDRACLDTNDLCFALVRWIVDIYHRTPHEGLGGLTPLEQWELDLEQGNYPLHAAPLKEEKLAAFGVLDERKVVNGGITVLGIRYTSPELGDWFLSKGSKMVQVRWNDQDLGTVSVFLDGAWVEAEAEFDRFHGVDAQTWITACRKLRKRDPKRKQWDEDVVFRAIKDISAMNAHRQLAYGILDKAHTPETLKALRQDAIQGINPTRRPKALPELVEVDDGYGRSIMPVEPAATGFQSAGDDPERATAPKKKRAARADVKKSASPVTPPLSDDSDWTFKK